MKSFSIILFCALSVVATIGLAYGLYPHAKLSETQLIKSTTPQAMESFEQVINLGDDFGEMSVIDLMGYYLDNPPAATDSTQISKPKRQFGGC
jgi:hypothetical protein